MCVPREMFSYVALPGLRELAGPLGAHALAAAVIRR